MSEPASNASSAPESAGVPPAPPSGVGQWASDLGYSPAIAAAALFSHTGPFHHDLVVAGARQLESLPGLGENARHRLHAAFIELAQNIARYSAERAGPPGAERGVGSIRLLSLDDARLLLVSENPVAPDAAPRLAASLDALAPLDAAALKILHRERRRAPAPPGSLGAGLGLIELHRHACAPVRHSLVPAAPGLPPLLRLALPLSRD